MLYYKAESHTAKVFTALAINFNDQPHSVISDAEMILNKGILTHTTHHTTHTITADATAAAMCVRARVCVWYECVL